ncbi:hypothetical protein LX64_05184 [Chitinophaga skermanii]|uniref:Uncharacterized protein n=2 Tax=Chitinophaga skermanii TaxID=331697 RepID=A0A327PZE0_9BACT|nr:hypothetical protein LX64_05184 [Chitinophaga skermanii]
MEHQNLSWNERCELGWEAWSEEQWQDWEDGQIADHEAIIELKYPCEKKQED